VGVRVEVKREEEGDDKLLLLLLLSGRREEELGGTEEGPGGAGEPGAGPLPSRSVPVPQGILSPFG